MFAERIREFRKSLNLSQAAFGEKIGRVQQVIAQWEKGSASPDPQTLALICNAYNVSADYLVGLTDDPHPIIYPAEVVVDDRATDTAKQMTDEQLAAALPEDVREAVLALIRIERAKETK